MQLKKGEFRTHICNPETSEVYFGKVKGYELIGLEHRLPRLFVYKHDERSANKGKWTLCEYYTGLSARAICRNSELNKFAQPTRAGVIEDGLLFLRLMDDEVIQIARDVRKNAGYMYNVKYYILND